MALTTDFCLSEGDAMIDEMAFDLNSFGWFSYNYWKHLFFDWCGLGNFWQLLDSMVRYN